MAAIIGKPVDFDMQIGRRSSIDPSLGKEWSRELKLQATAELVGRHIERTYPNYPFYVRVDGHIDGGAVLLSLPRLTGNYRHVITLETLWSDLEMHCVTEKCGEILERFGLRRGRRDYAEWRACLQKHPHPAQPVTYLSPDGTTVKVAPDAIK